MDTIHMGLPAGTILGSCKGVLMKIICLLLLCSTASAAEWKQEYRTVTATAYCSDTNCTVCVSSKYRDGKTATMRDASLPGVAVDRSVIPLGSRLDIPGYSNWQLADDTGSAIKGDKIDVRFADHQKAKEWGVRILKIRVWTKEKK
jgi:3D (Asp-Asp-Asp) domain-containing protein